MTYLNTEQLALQEFINSSPCTAGKGTESAVLPGIPESHGQGLNFDLPAELLKKLRPGTSLTAN